MLRSVLPLLALVPAPLLLAQAPTQTFGFPVQTLLSKAHTLTDLRSPGAAPFHLQLTITEPDNPQSPYQGSFEEWWASPTEWRREVASPATHLKQTIVMHDGTTTEQDTGDYLPHWLQTFVTAALELAPDAAAQPVSTLSIDPAAMQPGLHPPPCVRAKSQLGTGDRATDAFIVLCFDSIGDLTSFISPGFSIGFSDYRSFGQHAFPFVFTDSPEPGTTLVGKVTTLEDLSGPEDPALFAPLPTHDDRFHSSTLSSADLEKRTTTQLPIAWPPVHSGNTHGRLAMYIGVDSTGQVREAWPLNSDNAGLEDPARAQVMKWKLPSAPDGSKPGQLEGGLGFAFHTEISDPLPHLSDAEVRALASHQVEPQWPAGKFRSGTIVEAEISVNEQGKFTGSKASLPDAGGPVFFALSRWAFRPLIRDGKPQYFHGTVRFVVP